MQLVASGEDGLSDRPTRPRAPSRDQPYVPWHLPNNETKCSFMSVRRVLSIKNELRWSYCLIAVNSRARGANPPPESPAPRADLERPFEGAILRAAYRLLRRVIASFGAELATQAA